MSAYNFKRGVAMPLTSRDKGFTLIELLLVIIIIGLLSAFAIPYYLNIQKEAKIGSTKGKLAAIRGAIELAHAKIMISGVNTGPDGANPDWPTVDEIDANALVLPSRPESLRNLKLVRGYGDKMNDPLSLPPCNLPEMPADMAQNKTKVTHRSLGDILVVPPRADESSCWAYYPGNERDRTGKVVDAFFYINDDRLHSDNVDAADLAPSQW